MAKQLEIFDIYKILNPIIIECIYFLNYIWILRTYDLNLKKILYFKRLKFCRAIKLEINI